MANRIKIRRGSGDPGSNLLSYELGWDTTNKALYINDGGTSKITALPLTGGTLSGPVINNFNNNSVGRHFTDLCHNYLGASATGTIKITLPNTNSNMVMMVIRIILYTYNSDSGKELIISGYTYNNSTWYNYQATALGGNMAQTIRLAYDGTHYCILLGATNTVWPYTFVQLADVYSSFGAQPTSGYSISLITSESGYTVTATVGHAFPAMVTESYPALLPTDGINNWIKVGTANTSYGLLPSQAGGAGSGHNYLGTSSWYWKYAYIDEIYGHLNGNAATASGLVDGNSTMTSAYNKAGLNYGDYTWLAGWNGYELRAINKNQFAQASHTHSYLPLSGGTMTGWITFDAEQGIYARIKRKTSGSGGWAYAPYRFIGNDNNTFASIGVYGLADTLGYMYIGAGDWNSTVNTRIYTDGTIQAGGCAVIRDSGTTSRRIWVTTSSSYSSSYANGDIVLVKA